ncbi:CHASE2 domain-containing protein [Thermonema rossianum]|uniref:CHASE2 domain-containing protein n=1 Tax=Thermonema rossianum TaxID=55505 RepID=UPI0005709870|nr:CHASE2 domain-containing protein [Thermonema rossianum]
MRKFKFLLRDTFLIAIFTVLVIIGIMHIPFDFDAFNPIEQTLNDFDITDIYYSRIRGVDIEADTNIVLVNIGNLPREGIAEQLHIIRQFSPAVVGIDAFFSHLRGEPGDTLLAEALAQTPHAVLVTKVDYTSETMLKEWKPGELVPFDTLITSHPFFAQHALGGFANLITPATRENALISDLAGGLETCRSFAPQEITKDGKKHIAFAVKMAEILAPEKAKRFLERNKEVEYIHFRGNFQKFTVVDWPQLFEMYDAAMQGDEGAQTALQNIFRNKAVLLGFMGNTLNEVSPLDKFYTPMNPNYVGRAERDMYGVVVHANILSMILHEEYVDEMPTWLNLTIGSLVLLFSIMVFSVLYHKADFWYDGLSLLIQAILVLFLLYMIIIVFDKFSMKVDWGLAFLGVILSANLVEIYYGVVAKVAERFNKRKQMKGQVVDVDSSGSD